VSFLALLFEKLRQTVAFLIICVDFAAVTAQLVPVPSFDLRLISSLKFAFLVAAVNGDRRVVFQRNTRLASSTSVTSELWKERRCFVY